MRRILILTNDKSHAVQLRTVMESLRIEFEIAIGEEIGRTILSSRYMNLILIDASTLKAGTSWVFPFLATRRLHVPVVVLGAEEKNLGDVSGKGTEVRCLPPPIDQERLKAALEC